MANKLMTKDEIRDYVYENLSYFDSKEKLRCQEIGDGNINYVFKLWDEESFKSLVVKQSDDLLRSSGRPLDIGRSRIERDALVIKNDLAPGFLPKVYHYDQDLALIVMEDISEYKNLRKELIEGRIYENFPDQIGEFLAKSLLPTTDLLMDRKKKKEMAAKFTNPDMCDISEDLVFTEPYFDYKKRNIISPGLEDYVRENLYTNYKVQREVLILKDKFQSYSQALIHGDLHSGSIFVNKSGIKVIDPEFAFYGPMAYDYGNVWGNLVFPLARSVVLENDRDLVKGLKSLLIETIDKSIEKLFSAYDSYIDFPYFKNEDFKDFYLNSIVEDSFGYAGTEIIRRTVGDSKVEEIWSVKDFQKRTILGKILIELGIFLIMERKNLKSGKDLEVKFLEIIGDYGYAI